MNGDRTQNKNNEEFKKGYQPRNNIVKDEDGDLLADSHSILSRMKNFFSQILNVHGDNNIWQAEMHKGGPLVPEPGSSEVEIAIEKLQNCKVLIKFQQNQFKQEVNNSKFHDP
jgi:hypothetical protein